MHSDRHFHLKKTVPLKNKVSEDNMNFPPPSSFPSVPPYASSNLMPFHGIELQPSEVCPKNFLIFDQTDYQSQIMFHPAIAHKFPGSGLHIGTSYIEEDYERRNANLIDRGATSVNEYSDDIDALLSLEEDEQEYDEEEVSTAHTCGNHGSNSPDSYTFYGLKLKKNGSSSSSPDNSVGCSSNNNSQKKHRKMKKMVKVLRGIVPGGKEMNTVTVIDEAVKYLKSLKVEAQKLGVEN